MGIKFNSGASSSKDRRLDSLRVGDTFRFPKGKALYIASAYGDQWTHPTKIDGYTNLVTGVQYELGLSAGFARVILVDVEAVAS